MQASLQAHAAGLSRTLACHSIRVRVPLLFLRCGLGRSRPGARLVASCSTHDAEKKRVVFLGTPEVAAASFKTILDASLQDNSSFRIAGVVSQPGRPKGRGAKKVTAPTPVHQMALDQGIPADSIKVPIKANEEDFLEWLTHLQPHLCITAAYGNFLPQRFLDIPTLGTLNIHPSLLPRYRGAAPVPRSIESGDPEVGVSVAYTVLKMDAGPVLASEAMPSAPEVQAPEMLQTLFDRGSHLLLGCLDDVWEGRAPQMATAQDEAAVSHAAKMSSAESELDFAQPATVLHNKVRALAGWPGTRTHLMIEDATGQSSSMDIKVLETAVAAGDGADGAVGPSVADVAVRKDAMSVRCGDGSVINVLRVQPAGKKPMSMVAFFNGVANKTVTIVSQHAM